MKEMPHVPHRHSIRHQEWDYSGEGSYYVTICTKDKECLFGEVQEAKMVVNEYGKIVENIWHVLPSRFLIVPDVFQIMPNHIHFIIHVGAIHESPVIHQSRTHVRAHRDAPLQRSQRSYLSQIIGYLKMNSSKQIHHVNPDLIVWQRNYYEHIIRNEQDLLNIRYYIAENPANWEKDQNYSYRRGSSRPT